MNYWSRILFVWICVVIGTFPENDWSFNVGIDPPLSWAFNHIYENGFEFGKHIVFPHGPLAFFIYPLPNNILLATLINSLLKIILVLNISGIFEKEQKNRWVFIFGIAYFICIISDFNHLIIANIILLFCNYFNDEKQIYKAAAFILTAFAFYIKSYIAIVSGVVCFSFILYYFIFKDKDYKTFIYNTLFVGGAILFFWFLMYGTCSGFIEYCFGMFQLAQDNSSAVAYYPYNDWLTLLLFLMILFSLPFINKNDKSFFYGTLTTLCLFAAWKHGMAREDFFHVKGLWAFIVTSLIIYISFSNQNRFRNLVLAVVATLLLQSNMKNCVDYHPMNYELTRVKNFIDFVSQFSTLKNTSATLSKKNISSNKLPTNVKNAINKATVDIYPWDYSIIAANDLNWQPRVVIQSYASYTHWLDNKNAEHFNSEKAPEYIIWDLNKFTQDFNGGTFNSIDYRYILNDEPLTMIQILKNYVPFYNDNKFLVLKRKVNAVNLTRSIVGSTNLHWGKWLDVPMDNKGLLRAQLQFTRSLAQRLKSFFYKDEQFWIYLKLENDIIHKYRIVPKNAVDGIWINPYILDSISNHKVKQISFKCSNQRILSKDITINWEKFQFDNNPEYVLNFFNIKNIKDSILVNSLNNFEKRAQFLWQNVATSDLSIHSFTGINSYVLKPNTFSPTFTIQIDSIPSGKLKISTDCWMNSFNYKYKNNISIIISIEDKNGNLTWKGLSIDEQLLGNNEWYNISNYINYKNENPNAKLKIYVWNNSDQELLMDDFRVRITTYHKL